MPETLPRVPAHDPDQHSRFTPRALVWVVIPLLLLAMVLAIGLVVDDAIVVLENIYRHIEEGMDPFSAAIKGSREIGFAVVAMTLTLAAVFAPLSFTPGRTGKLFTEFALALAGSVIVSGFVALTLSPMMSAKLLKHNTNPGWFDRTMDRALTRLSDGYAALLDWVLTKARWLVLLIMAGSGVAIAVIYPAMKQELAPLEDRGVLLATVTAGGVAGAAAVAALAVTLP